jgi:acyl carrier protein
MSNTVLSGVSAIIAEVMQTPSDTISLSSKLRDDIGADSLDSVEIVMAVEDKFNIQFKESDAESMVTVGDLVTFIEKTNSLETV